MMKRGPSQHARVLLGEPPVSLPANVSDTAQCRIAPQGLHGIAASVVSDHIKRRSRDLPAVANPGALIADRSALVVEPASVLDLTGQRFRPRINQRLGNFMPKDDGHAVFVACRRRVDKVLAADRLRR
jgi:hypothetical protein